MCRVRIVGVIVGLQDTTMVHDTRHSTLDSHARIASLWYAHYARRTAILDGPPSLQICSLTAYVIGGERQVVPPHV